jgi:hypothetical protein
MVEALFESGLELFIPDKLLPIPVEFAEEPPSPAAEVILLKVGVIIFPVMNDWPYGDDAFCPVVPAGA